MAAPASHVAVLAAVLLLLLPSLLARLAVAQPTKGAKAFCISQFAIASQACSILPPSPPDEHHHHDDDDEDEDDHDDDEHHDRDRRRSHHAAAELRAYRDCCRWLKEVQKDCVCEALLRLPPFLVKPQHTYVVRVGRTCKITYRCGGV
ncbi:unnamed protein product [Miscanthus lutarioriparius]|uniref:Bifunctional inhibitor/plant lipid transfer protein/seed storage helical domain-containing protein n=1 Tax=Miscanthus lutarioriparius TaxID=422564 RepID=A0A811MNT4_9POAL|nr:unnamed protein product [Miscanthus lutarioriparius]